MFEWRTVSQRKLFARAITIFPTLWKRMGLADTLTARSQMFHAPLRSPLYAAIVSVYAYACFPNSNFSFSSRLVSSSTRVAAKLPFTRFTRYEFDFTSESFVPLFLSLFSFRFVKSSALTCLSLVIHKSWRYLAAFASKITRYDDFYTVAFVFTSSIETVNHNNGMIYFVLPCNLTTLQNISTLFSFLSTAKVISFNIQYFVFVLQIETINPKLINNINRLII